MMPEGRQLIEKPSADRDYDARENYRLGRFFDGLKVVDIIKSNYTDLTNKSILDIACGFGGQISAFLASGAFVVGTDFIDYNFHTLQTTLNNGPSSSVAFVISDMNFLPFKKESFDLIYSNAGIEHLTDFQLKSFLSLIRGMMKKDGLAFLSFSVALQGL